MDELPFWIQANGGDLAQGDYLPKCIVPILDPDFDTKQDGEVLPLHAAEMDLIILTQTCDFENKKAVFAALCPIFSLEKFSEINEKFKKPSEREQLRKHRFEGLHLLTSPTEPDDNNKCVVVDFRQIFSLPVSYLERHANALGDRWRLQSPYLEHFSQALAKFFMRVGLPAQIKSFTA